MKKRLSHFPYNERSRPGWTPSTSLQKPLSPIRSTMKTVTYVPGTFVTLVPGPYSRGNWGLYGLFDQVLVQFGERGSNRGFGITGSFMVSPDQSVSQMRFFSTAGVLVRGLFPSRPTDVGGFGVVYGRFSADRQP